MCHICCVLGLEAKHHQGREGWDRLHSQDWSSCGAGEGAGTGGSHNPSLGAVWPLARAAAGWVCRGQQVSLRALLRGPQSRPYAPRVSQGLSGPPMDTSSSHLPADLRKGGQVVRNLSQVLQWFSHSKDCSQGSRHLITRGSRCCEHQCKQLEGGRAHSQLCGPGCSCDALIPQAHRQLTGSTATSHFPRVVGEPPRSPRITERLLNTCTVEQY